MFHPVFHVFINVPRGTFLFTAMKKTKKKSNPIQRKLISLYRMVLSCENVHERNAASAALRLMQQKYGFIISGDFDKPKIEKSPK